MKINSIEAQLLLKLCKPQPIIEINPISGRGGVDLYIYALNLKHHIR